MQPPVHPTPQSNLPPVVLARVVPAGPATMGYRRPSPVAGYPVMDRALLASSPPLSGVYPLGPAFPLGRPPLPTRGLPEAVAPADRATGRDTGGTSMGNLGSGSGAGALPTGGPLRPPGDIEAGPVGGPEVHGVPEPGSWLMLGIGGVMAIMAFLRRRRAANVCR